MITIFEERKQKYASSPLPVSFGVILKRVRIAAGTIATGGPPWRAKLKRNNRNASYAKRIRMFLFRRIEELYSLVEFKAEGLGSRCDEKVD